MHWQTLARTKPLPPITWKNWHKEIQFVSVLALTIVPLLSLYGAFTTRLTWQTAVWSVVYYFYTGLGITAGALLALSSFRDLAVLTRLFSQQVTTATGPIGPTMRPFLYNTFSLWAGPEPLRARFVGGLAATERIIATPIRISTLTQPTKVSSGRTSAG